MSSVPAQLVREFHDAFGVAIGVPPTFALRRLRAALLTEELSELAKELADVVYVAYGTALSFGIDLDEVIRAVHESNMSKLGDDGKPVYREDGKVLKGPNYCPPDLVQVLADGPSCDGGTTDNTEGNTVTS